MKKFEAAISNFERIIAQSSNDIDLSHAKNTLYWLNVLCPNADELLRLAAFAHDVERAMPDRLKKKDFPSYETYKRAHAKRSGQIVSNILRDIGYTSKQTKKVAYLIESAEFSSNDGQVQCICDADSISFFDNNILSYLNKHGVTSTKEKMNFMYMRASPVAQQYIGKLLKTKPMINSLM